MTAASLLVDCWESASRSPVGWRSVALLLPAEAGADAYSLAHLSVGATDARLLDLRRRLFGDQMEGLVRCPACATEMDVDFRASDVRLEGPTEPVMRATFEGWSVDFRLPDGFDMQAAASASDVEEAHRLLIERCVLGVSDSSQPRGLQDAPPQLLASMEEAMATADPQADQRFDLTCPVCGGGWEAEIDLASFISSEVASGARRMLREVHALAEAYGWSEDQILGLPAGRRQAYLDLVAGT